MTEGMILYGPNSEPFNTYAAVTPTPITGRPGPRPLGTQLVLQDGQKFRFAENNGSTAAIQGDVQQSAAIITTDQSLACAVTALNSRIITFTHGAATVAANYFAEGYGIISLDPGQGQAYKISDHLALQSAVAGDVINLAPGNAVRVALTTVSDLSLLASPYFAVLIMAATISGMPVGVAVSAIAVNAFGWLQTRGVGAVRGAASNTIGSPGVMLLTGGTAGAVAPASAATQPVVGYVQMVEGTGEAQGLYITLDG